MTARRELGSSRADMIEQAPWPRSLIVEMVGEKRPREPQFETTTGESIFDKSHGSADGRDLKL